MAVDYSTSHGARTLYNYFYDFIQENTLGTTTKGVTHGQRTYQNMFIDFLTWAAANTVALYLNNDEWISGRNAADDAWLNIFKLNTSDNVEWGVTQEIGNSYWGLNPGVTVTDYMNISSVSADGVTHGMVLAQIGGYNMITTTRDSDGAGDSDTPLTTINSVLQLTPMATPSTGSEGMIYANSSDNHLYYYNGSSWVQLDN